MKKKLLFFNFLLFIIYSFNLLAINFPEKSNKIEDFIPKGWKSLIIKKGDLNRDKIEDVVLVIEKNDSKNFKEPVNTYYGYFADVICFNPRIILVLFKDENSQYILITKNEEGFIVSEGVSLEEGYEILSAPIFGESLSNSISIKNNTLQIHTSLGWIKGSSFTDYIFKYQNKQFELIDLKTSIFRNEECNTLKSNKFSINFLNKKLEKDISVVKREGNKEKKLKEEKTIESIEVKCKYSLDAMTKETAREILNKYIYKNDKY